MDDGLFLYDTGLKIKIMTEHFFLFLLSLVYCFYGYFAFFIFFRHFYPFAVGISFFDRLHVHFFLFTLSFLPDYFSPFFSRFSIKLKKSAVELLNDIETNCRDEDQSYINGD